MPLLSGRRGLFARRPQFAGAAYGPVVASGLAAWHGRDGNYWGHNAIIRIAAFAAAAGLPELAGKKPFGGHILSHDFVEAALMRRAGWAVYMLPDLGGSFEQSPPGFIELAALDRRWTQGDLQHLKVISASGLHWMSRLHLLQGIMSYLASPCGSALILIGLGLRCRRASWGPTISPRACAVSRMADLRSAAGLAPVRLHHGGAAVAEGARHGPGAGRQRAPPRLRRRCGVVASLVAEIVLSSLMAPVMMLVQTLAVTSIVMGRDAGWAPQNRADGSLAFSLALSFHARHMIFGLVLAAAAVAVSPSTALWMLPVVAGLVLAAPLTWFTASPLNGRRARALRLFVTPPEQLSGRRARAEDAPMAIAAE